MKHKSAVTVVLFAASALVAQVGVARAWTAKVDLISPTTCTKLNGRLHDCAIPTTDLSGSVTETAVPVRTTLKVLKSGDCTTHYPLPVSITVTGETVVKFAYLRENGVTFRRHDGSNVSAINVADASVWTQHLNVVDTCRISLSVNSNEVDVDTEAQARATIARIQTEIDGKKAQAQQLRDLIEMRSAFLFLQSVAENYHGELTNDLIQELRDGAANSVPALAALANNCAANLTETDNQNLIILMMDLPQLGSSSDWKNPDGTTKSLADVMGPDAGAIYQTVVDLAKGTSTASGSTYEQQYKAAVAEQVNLESKLVLAQAQLAAWL